jgi:outer membrane protein assembly factor BamB
MHQVTKQHSGKGENRMQHRTRKTEVFTTAMVSTIILCLLALLLLSHWNIYAAPPQEHTKTLNSSGDWPGFLYSDTHQGNNPNETSLNTSNASSLKLKWKFKTPGALIAEPVIVNGIIYQGSNDGNMYAINATTQQQVWQTFLGRHSIASCPVAYGITGTAAVDSGMVFIGEGYTFYALSANDGHIVWQTSLAINANLSDNVLWGAASVANGKVYIGLASDCDKPLIQGTLYALDENTGNILAMAKMVPDSLVGGGIWTAPTIDATTHTVIVSTGSVEKSPPFAGMSASVVTLDWDTLTVKQFWQVPASERIKDADWGATPTLFPGQNGKTYFGCFNKNSTYYVFDEANVADGPVWQDNLGVGGALAGHNASFATSAYVNGTLFIASALTTINGTIYASSIGAFNSLTGHNLWRWGLTGNIFASLTTANGLLFDGQGKTFEVRDQSNGNVLFTYAFPNGSIKGAITVLGGMVFVPSVDNKLYAFGL